MVSTFTPNIQLEEPARGDDVGTWDTPVNNNMTLVDLVCGGIATISLNNSNVVLAAAQFECRNITFISTLTGSVTITFPTSFKKSYEIQHLCTGSSAFTITLATTAGGQSICAIPGETIDVFNDGSNLKYKGLGRVGEYMDIAGSSVPNWISGCSLPPYLNCDGTAFSSANYPQLAIRLGGTTLPDARGRFRLALDQGVGRVSSAASGTAGNTLLSGGGDQLMQAHVHAVFLTDPTHSHTVAGSQALRFGGGGATGAVTGGSGAPIFSWTVTDSAATGMGIGSAPGTSNNLTTSQGSGGAQNMPPTLVCGLTLIRAA